MKKEVMKGNKRVHRVEPQTQYKSVRDKKLGMRADSRWWDNRIRVHNRDEYAAKRTQYGDI